MRRKLSVIFTRGFGALFPLRHLKAFSRRPYFFRGAQRRAVLIRPYPHLATTYESDLVYRIRYLCVFEPGHGAAGQWRSARQKIPELT
jgi:hypothetical protein